MSYFKLILMKAMTFGLVVVGNVALADADQCNDDFAICQLHCSHAYYFQREDCNKGCSNTLPLCLQSPRGATELVSSPGQDEKKSPPLELPDYKVELNHIILDINSVEKPRLFSQVNYAYQPIVRYNSVKLTHQRSNTTWSKSSYDGTFVFNFELDLSSSAKYFNHDDSFVLEFFDHQNPNQAVACKFNLEKYDRRQLFPSTTLEELGCELSPVEGL